MLGDLEERLSNRCDGLSSQFQDTRFRTSERLDHVSRLIEDTTAKFSKQIADQVSASDSRTSQLVSEAEARIASKTEQLRQDISDQISVLRNQMEQIPKLPSQSVELGSLDPIRARIDEVNRAMSELTNSTLPEFVKEIDSSLISAEYKTEEKKVRLLQDLCVDFDSDINRLVELVHSVYVQANLTMPPGTLTSWRKFKEVMFDDNGGRKPILGEAVLNHLAQPRIKNHASPGRSFSRS